LPTIPLSEDLQHGQRIERMTIVDPFLEGSGRTGR
jgi:predicted nucleic acid-binding protein